MKSYFGAKHALQKSPALRASTKEHKVHMAKSSETEEQATQNAAVGEAG